MTELSTERAIGNLEGKVDLLIKAVAEQKAESSAGRGRIYQELEAIRADASVSKAKVEKLEAQMVSAAPAIADINRWKERMIGMGIAFGMIGFFAAAGMQLLWKWIAAKFGI